MIRMKIGIGLLAFAFATALVAPASAEPLGCVNQQPSGKNVERCNGASSYALEFAARSRPRITIHPRRIYPGPNAKRYCRSWLAKEYRVSGPVIVPQMHCWWQ